MTSVDFAVELMEKLEGGYDAVGYVRPRSSAEQRAKRCQPLRVALGQYEQLVDYLHELCAQRSAALSGIKSAAGPEMSFDLHHSHMLLFRIHDQFTLIRTGCTDSRLIHTIHTCYYSEFTTNAHY